MRRTITLSSFALVLSACVLRGQDLGFAAADSRKQAVAIRVPTGAIDVDGRLVEDAWQKTRPITDFVQKEPTEGAMPTEKMDVRIVYDDEAIYVGARMYSSDPSLIQAPLTRRDAVDTQSEHIFISLDTFLDRRTAYTFGVSASGVRLDRFHPLDDEEGADPGFDPVWQARTQIDERGWTAELWIPFSQLRFNNQTEQVWGLNVFRSTPTLQETGYWVLVPTTERAWASRFGELSGIRGVRPTRRLELLPNVVGASTMNANRALANPFDTGANLTRRVGADLKLGLGPNLTLDATINPDFGQVEADPAVVNLTAFETIFPEKRPFFSEGAQLLNIGHPNFFYSRRIGARPIVTASGDYVDSPDFTTILTAAKITGRLSNGMSIGVLSALTGAETARVATRGSLDIATTRVAPRASFNVAKVQQELGREGSMLSMAVASVFRDFQDDDPLGNILPRRAVVFGGDSLLRFNGGEYEVKTAVLGSYIGGAAPAIERIQRSSVHYMQRPDKSYGNIDPTRTSLSGLSLDMTVDRREGTHWLFGAWMHYETVGFETNDVGRLNAADGIQPSGYVTYRETRPGRIFRNYSIRLNQANEWNHGWDRQRGAVQTSINVTWLNFWTSSLSVDRSLRLQDARLTRGGPLMGVPRNWSITGRVANSLASRTRWSAETRVVRDELGGHTNRASASLSIRPGPRWQVSVQPVYERTTDAQQYVTTLNEGRPETYGNRYIFAYIARSTVSTQFRFAFTLKPDVNLDVYAEPFAASGRYYDYGELLAPASLERIKYGTAGTTLRIEGDGSQVVTAGASSFALENRDFNIRSFRSTVVLRWEWRPGSTLYAVWQQNRYVSETLGARVGFDDASRSLGAPGSNTLLIKTSFWIPVGVGKK